jgi:hypothetical protein
MTTAPKNSRISSGLKAHPEQLSTNPNQTLPMPELFNLPQEWPHEIIVEPSRLAMGIWGDTEGDIQAAYCADTFPQVKAFLHEGQLYTNCGGTEDSMNCYPLIPPEQFNCRSKQPYSHEGESVIYKKQSFKVGPKIQFTARPRTLEEETSLLQRMYAFGGHFASGKTYKEVLLQFLDRDRISQGRKAAIEAELTRENLPSTQAEMLGQLGIRTDKSNCDDRDAKVQQTFLGF